MKLTHQPPYVIFVPYNGKIADITHADTNKHTIDLETILSETRKIIAVTIYAHRVSGTGAFQVYPNEGNSYLDATEPYRSPLVFIKDGTQNVQYNLTVANDDWDVYCMGYVVRSRW